MLPVLDPNNPVIDTVIKENLHFLQIASEVAASGISQTDWIKTRSYLSLKWRQYLNDPWSVTVMLIPTGKVESLTYLASKKSINLYITYDFGEETAACNSLFLKGNVYLCNYTGDTGIRHKISIDASSVSRILGVVTIEKSTAADTYRVVNEYINNLKENRESS